MIVPFRKQIYITNNYHRKNIDHIYLYIDKRNRYMPPQSPRRPLSRIIFLSAPRSPAGEPDCRPFRIRSRRFDRRSSGCRVAQKQKSMANTWLNGHKSDQPHPSPYRSRQPSGRDRRAPIMFRGDRKPPRNAPHAVSVTGEEKHERRLILVPRRSPQATVISPSR